jgi:type I restriction enzyme S subunit
MNKEFPNTKFGTLVLAQPKSNIKAGEGKTKGNFPFFTSSPVQTKYLDKYIYQGPAIIFGTGGGASVHTCEGPFATSTDCLVYYPASKNVYIKYLYRYLLGNIHILQRGFKGAGLQHISKTYIENLDIPFPNIKEQENIVKRLDKVQELIALQKEQLKKLDDLIKSRFIDLFGDPIRDEKEFKKDILGVGITILSDYHANGSYEILKQHVELLSKPDYALMIRTTDLENKNYTDGVNYITEKAYNFLEKSKIYGGEIIINKIGSAGKIYFMPYLNRPVSLGMNAFLLRFDKKLLNNVFVYYMLGTNSITTEIQKRVKGAVTKTITKDAIRELPIIYPPIELQNKFADFVTKIESQKGLLTTRLSHLETLYKSLMQEYFG